MPSRNLRANEKKPGRMVICSNCARTTAEGTTQVFRKVVFHFCLPCWQGLRTQCCAWMQRVCGSTPSTASAKIAA